MVRQDSQLTWYISGNALWMGAYSLQQLLVTWILVGILQESPERTGIAQMLIGIPGLIFMLWGGVIGDRMDGRKLLVRTHYLCAIPPLILALGAHFGLLGYWFLILVGLAMSLMNSASSPVRATILNLVAGKRLQYAISLSTGVGAIAAIVGTKLGGEIEYFGLTLVLLIQSAVFVLGGLLTRRLLPAKPDNGVKKQSALSTIFEGLRHVWQFKLCRDLVTLNFISSLFNAGAWLIAVPFIINRVYAGDAASLANMLIIFTFGSLIANFGLLKFMPLKRPGKLYLSMQLTRIFILVLIWIKPDEHYLWLAAGLWGFNMGITQTTSRLMLQEIATVEFRARIMSIYTLTLMSSAPLGSLVLGFIIASWGPLNALLPGMVASVVIFAFGLFSTGIWRYESPVPE